MVDLVHYIFSFLLCIISTMFHQYIPAKYKYMKKPTTHLHVPPSPPSLPIFGHLHYLSLPMHKCLQNLSFKYGSLLYLRFGLQPFLIVSSASTAIEIFRTNDLSFASRPESPFGTGLLLGTNGLILAPYGEYWRFMKKCSMAKLLGSLQLDQSCNVRREELRLFLTKVLNKALNNEVLNVREEVMKLVRNTMSRMTMSTRLDDHEAEMCSTLMDKSVKLAGKMALTFMFGPLKKLGIWFFQRQMSDVNERYDELLEKILRDHEEKFGRVGKVMEEKDLADILLQLHNTKNAEIKISRSQVKAILLDIFLGGTNTLTDSIQWVVANLLKHPTVLKKLRNEIESVVGRNKLVDETDVPNLHYLRLVVKESLRLHPPFPLIPRASIEDCKIRGFHIPKDTAVAINAYAIMRDPEIWENPEEFCPERFLTPRKEQNFHFVVFGGGRRICPGSKLALNLVYITVAAMVQCFDLKVVAEDNKVKVNMEVKPGVTMEMRHPFYVFLLFIATHSRVEIIISSAHASNFPIFFFPKGRYY